VVAACLPDVDFAWGRHNMETHSVGFALILGAATLAWRPSAKVALACALSVSTHVLLDWLGSDDRAPFGVMALWPFTSEFFYADAWLFGAISRHYWRPDFVSQNVLAVLREMAILVPFMMALCMYRRKKFAAARRC
jgi:inner membrane protein